jgi:putative endonuclease
MSWVYILKSGKNDSYYVGSTNDLERRLVEHNTGKTPYLRNLLPVKLVFRQEFSGLIEARKVESKLKKFKNKKIIEKIIQAREIKMKI